MNTNVSEPHAGGAAQSHASAEERIRTTRRFNIEDIELLANAHRRFDCAPGTPWDNFRDSFLVLPCWFRFDLDPMSAHYAQQQHRLWNIVAGQQRAYHPLTDEQTSMPDVDAIRFPAYFQRRGPEAIQRASDHILATGMLLKHAGVRPGEWALEYGAGFAQTALHFARLGVNVDTVDISEEFCRHVKTQADFYQVSLTPFCGSFGWNPRGARKYDLIWFYESFHHCLDFKNAVLALKRDLAPCGRVLLAGEPISRRENPNLPYPWGLRLGSDNIAVVRCRHWFELGFSKDFLVSLLTSAGFVGERMECAASNWAQGYIFRHRGPRIHLAKHWLPTVEDETWHRHEKEGRWTRESSCLSLDTTDSFTALEIEATNHHPVVQSLRLQYGSVSADETFGAGERRTVRIGAATKNGKLVFRSRALVPARDYEGQTPDARALGIFVHEVRYV